MMGVGRLSATRLVNWPVQTPPLLLDIQRHEKLRPRQREAIAFGDADQTKIAKEAK
jgi:hypothetical protein